MGYIKDEAIIVTGNHQDCQQAHNKAIELGLHCTGIREHETNEYVSFLIVPDGSKEGWEASRVGDDQRELWKIWARDAYGKRVDDEWFFVRWVHVSYDDEGECRVVDNWHTHTQPED
jgi:hypothetical protein